MIGWTCTYRNKWVVISNIFRSRFLEYHFEKWMNRTIFSIRYLLRSEETAAASGDDNLLPCEREDGFNTHDRWGIMDKGMQIMDKGMDYQWQ